MPEQTAVDLKVSATKPLASTTILDSLKSEVDYYNYFDNAEMDAELRILEPTPAETRPSVDPEPEGASTDDAEEMTPQDLSVHKVSQTPSPITLSEPIVINHSNIDGTIPSRTSDVVAVSRKRKSTSPNQDRRAKWAMGNTNGDNLPSLSPSNGRPGLGLGTNNRLPEDYATMAKTNHFVLSNDEKSVIASELKDKFLPIHPSAPILQTGNFNDVNQHQSLRASDSDEEPLNVASNETTEDTDTTPRLPQSLVSTPQQSISQPRHQPFLPGGLNDEEEMGDLMTKISRAQETLRTDVEAAVSRFCNHVEESVRTTCTNLQTRSLQATLSAAAAAASAAVSAANSPPMPIVPPPLPQLADVNGNPAPPFNLKDMTKTMELAIASQWNYRLLAASNRLPNPLNYSTPGGPGMTAGGLGSLAGVGTVMNPLLGLHQHMTPAFPMPTPICSSPNGGVGAGPDSVGGCEGCDSDMETGDGSPVNMSKKKRTKVTDNHLRNFAASMDPITAASVLTPTLELFNSVAQSAANAAAAANASAAASVSSTPMSATPTTSLTNSPLRGPANAFNDLSSSTLTPVHLRKAKLMFFYTRYPNSNVLKVYFPDVKFNKHNTAQIVKWFSNFREFYYIQIEKFARQAIGEGVQEPDEIAIMPECELIRTLNVHYNRNNQIQVPIHFVNVVEITVKEFFKALISHKDQDHSWKKPIYKVIARFDQTVPEEFKSSNWIDHLEG